MPRISASPLLRRDPVLRSSPHVTLFPSSGVLLLFTAVRAQGSGETRRALAWPTPSSAIVQGHCYSQGPDKDEAKARLRLRLVYLGLGFSNWA